ncbi:MAG: ERCC4 domain-containing protein, partial [Candidatus Neomarinimicrobiota bacterium]
MKIKVDNREHTLIKLLKALNKDYEFNLDIEVAKMDLGDIAIMDETGAELLLIERKKITDLAASIRDGRYQEQSYRLNGYSLHNHNIMYMIEGKISFFSNKYSK